MAQKLRGIYDALDNGSHKSALKLCAAFLAKQPGHLLCKSLSAVALERLGRWDEAVQLCDDVRASPACTDDVLGTLQVVYRRCREFARCTEMYDAAWSREADCEDYALALFLAATRTEDAAKAQQAAIKMYRKFSKPKYLHWIVVSILLQARADGSTRALDLASMWLQKAPVSPTPAKTGASSFDRSQHYLLLLHLSTLRQQGKIDEALALLEANRCHMPLTSDHAAVRLRLLEESGQLRQAVAEARAEVIRKSSSWEAAQEYIRLAFLCPVQELQELERLCWEGTEVPDHGARVRADPSEESETPEDLDRRASSDEVRNAAALFRRPALLNGAALGARTACLAQLELLRRAFAENERAALADASADDQGAAKKDALRAGGWEAVVAPNDLEAYTKGISEYLCRFGHRSSTFFELSPYLSSLTDARVRKILASVVGGEKADARAITVARISHACERNLCREALEEQAREALRNLRSWEEGLQQDGDDPKVVSSFSEEQLLLQLTALVDMDRASARPGDCLDGRPYMLSAIVYAEVAASVFPQCFHFKVLLVLLCGSVGCVGMAAQMYARLEVKNIQHESLSHLLLTSLRAFGNGPALREACRAVAHYHEDADKDHIEAINMALQNGVYHRISEYVEAAEKMSRSESWGSAVVEDMMADSAQATTWEALQEALTRRFGCLRTIAGRPMDYWVVSTQDRRPLSGLHLLPLRSPLQQEAMPTTSTTAATPSALGGAHPPRPGTSTVLVWSGCDGGAAEAVDIGVGVSNVGALEALLTRGLAHAPALLKLRASLLSVPGAVCSREGPSEERLAEAVATAGETLRSIGVDLAVAAEQPQVTIEGAPVGLESWLLGYRACEASLRLVRCSASGAGADWDAVEKDFAGLTAQVAASADNAGASAGARALGLGDERLQRLWSLLGWGLGTLVPLALWYSSSLPKTSGKKVKDSEKPLHAARVALRGLLAALQKALCDIQLQLAAASSPDLGAAVADLPSALPAERLRRTVDAMSDAHRSHLEALKELAGSRLALLKSKGTFKP